MPKLRGNASSRGDRSAKRQPSHFCHICASKSAYKRSELKHCCNLNTSKCTKSFCEECFVKSGWDWERAKLDDDWECPHCQGCCPPNAQCLVYRAINKRIRDNRKGKGGKNVRVEGLRGGADNKPTSPEADADSSDSDDDEGASPEPEVTEVKPQRPRAAVQGTMRQRHRRMEGRVPWLALDEEQEDDEFTKPVHLSRISSSLLQRYCEHVGLPAPSTPSFFAHQKHSDFEHRVNWHFRHSAATEGVSDCETDIINAFVGTLVRCGSSSSSSSDVAALTRNKKRSFVHAPHSKRIHVDVSFADAAPAVQPDTTFVRVSRKGARPQRALQPEDKTIPTTESVVSTPTDMLLVRAPLQQPAAVASLDRPRTWSVSESSQADESSNSSSGGPGEKPNLAQWFGFASPTVVADAGLSGSNQTTPTWIWSMHPRAQPSAFMLASFK